MHTYAHLKYTNEIIYLFTRHDKNMMLNFKTIYDSKNILQLIHVKILPLSLNTLMPLLLTLFEIVLENDYICVRVQF